MDEPTLPATVEEEAATDGNRTITILSPKGGAGKTTVSTNLAVGLARRFPRQVVLIDLDLQFGDVASNLRLQPKTTLVDLARKWPVDSAQLKLALTAHQSGLFALCSPINPAEADEISAAHVAGVIRSLQKSFAFIVVDTDPGLTERVLSALDLSTDIVMVASKEIPSIRGLRKAIEALDLIGLSDARRLLLLNRADTKVGLEIEDVERTIGHKINVRINSSLDMVLATNDGVPIIESGRNPELASAFEHLVDEFDERTPAGEASKGGLRLFKRKP